MSSTENDAHAGAKKLGEAARDGVGAYAETGKRAGADTLHTMARAVGAAADQLEESSPELARFTREAAAATDRLSDSVRDRSLNEIGRGISDFARREPVAFFGAALLAGFAATRFLASSARPDYDERFHDDSFGDGPRREARSGSGATRAPDPLRADADRSGLHRPAGTTASGTATATNPEQARHTAGGAGLKH